VKIKLYFLLNKKCVFKSVIAACLVVLISLDTEAQRFYSVVFNKLPQNYQLYPRDAQNEALVPVSGKIEAAGYTHMSVQVFRNKDLLKYLKAPIKYDNQGIGTFATETKIKAELAEYSFRVYACKTTDSVLMVTRENVVSGDAYILSGQSNSTGFFSETETSEYCRTFGAITENLNTNPYNPADTLWALSNQQNYTNGVGTMGLEIQKQLSARSGVPNCLINGGFHWSSAANHAYRNPANPIDLGTGYGKILYRVQKAGLANAVQAYIFRQGETEAYHEGFDWPLNFEKLRSNLKLDYAGLKKIYVFQIDIIFYPSPVGAQVRDYQRRLPELFSDVKSLATVGTKEFDGLHYGTEGNRQSGFELSRLMARDFYQSKDTLNINSPAIKRAFYKTEDKKQLVLSFDDGQELVYPEKYKVNANLTLDMKDFFFLNGSAGSVISGKAEGSRIILELNGSQNASTLNYLPDYLPEGGNYYPFNGPFLTNKLGMRALTFYNLGISVSLKTPVLTSSAVEGAIVLSWADIQDATGYVLERKLASEMQYRVIANMTSTTKTFSDNTFSGSGKISYRLKAINKISESAEYGYTEIAAPVLLGIPVENDDLFSVFPNPVSPNQKITVRFKKPANGAIGLINSSGQIISEQNVNQQTETTFTLPQIPASSYFIRVKRGDYILSKKILIN